jgi:hypothetical protein
MSLRVFRQALELAKRHNQNITLGGGEPTVHPLFEQFVFEATAFRQQRGVFIITNGKDKKRALFLAGLTERKTLEALLSQDTLHEPIDPEVVNVFKRMNKTRTIFWGDITNIGRAKKNNIGRTNLCICPDVIVRPNGELTQCGCRRSPIVGHVDTGLTAWEGFENWERDGVAYWNCYKRNFQVNWANVYKDNRRARRKRRRMGL